MNELTIIIIALIAFQILSYLSTWRLFKLAGQAPWKAAIPVYSQLTMLQLNQRPSWWIVFIFLPVIGPVMLLVIYADFIRLFGKRGVGDMLLTTFLGLLFIGYINYNKDTKFYGVEDRKETLIASLMFAVILATTIHTYIVQPMIIPTGSMENTLRIGDALFVEKLSYGPRIPNTPVAIPFSDIFWRKGYLKELQIPYFRLPGWRNLKANDIVVFNYPTDSIHQPTDRKDPYVKRLVGMPGDTLQIINAKLQINGKDFIPKKDAIVQYAYEVVSKVILRNKYLEEEFELVNDGTNQSDYFVLQQNQDGSYLYRFNALSDKHVNNLRKNPNIISIKKIIQPPNQRFDYSYQPNTKTSNFSVSDSANLAFPLLQPNNQDNYGPLYIPKKGDVIKLTKANLAQYFNIINKFEENQVKIKNNQLYVNGKVVESYDYEIQQDYYFMMGDNRHNSLDARYFGYVPDSHIIGRPVLLWANLNNVFGFEKKHGWKWERWFTVPNNNSPQKSSYLWLAMVVLGSYFAWDYFRARKKRKKEN